MAAFKHAAAEFRQANYVPFWEVGICQNMNSASHTKSVSKFEFHSIVENIFCGLAYIPLSNIFREHLFFVHIISDF